VSLGKVSDRDVARASSTYLVGNSNDAVEKEGNPFEAFGWRSDIT